MIGVSIEVKGDKEFLAAIDQVLFNTTDLTFAWLEIQHEYFDVMAQQFRDEGTVSKWPPLSPAYKKWKDRVAPGKPILQLSGRLVESLTSASAPDNISIITAKMATFGTKVANERTRYPYPFAHQMGLGHNPVRKPMEFKPADIGRWIGIIGRHIVSGTGDFGHFMADMAHDYGVEENF